MLLSRVANRIYWAARYLERAEDTARVVRAHGEMIADLPTDAPESWRSLVAVVGSSALYDERFGDGAEGKAPPEARVVEFLLADSTNVASVVSCVTASRENLRTTRETVTRDGWQALNDLHLYVGVEVDRGGDRRARERFLSRVIGDSRRIDGILATTMIHDEAYVMWRLGRAIERADMTTRVLGVRAAAVLLDARPERAGDGATRRYDELEWMGVLKSVWGMQMYQRSVSGPIEGERVVRFLLEHDRFPRAVRALLREVRSALRELPDPSSVIDGVDEVDAALRDSTAAGVDGAALDGAMDALQEALARLDQRIHARYLRLG